MSKVIEDTRIFPFGDTAIVIEFGQSIAIKTHKRVKALVDYLAVHPFPGMIECILAYTNVTVFYNPLIVREQLGGSDSSKNAYRRVKEELEKVIDSLGEQLVSNARIIKIPVCYEGEFAPDLAFVAKHNNLSEAEVIEIHTSGEYLVYMIGFAPGFPFLGGMPLEIATPRRSSPRLAIPAGSVGIAGQQTGVYPIETPGGWQLIGRTPSILFQVTNDPPTLLMAGDLVKFYPISTAEYKERLSCR